MGQIWSIDHPWHCIALSPSALLQVSFLPLAWLSGKLIQLAMLGFHEDEVDGGDQEYKSKRMIPLQVLTLE